MRQTIDDSFTVSAQAVIRDRQSFSYFADSAESGVFRTPQEIIHHSIEKLEQSRFVFEPREGWVFESHFDHGVIENTHGQLSVALNGNQVAVAKEDRTDVQTFFDLRYASDSRCTPIASCDELFDATP